MEGYAYSMLASAAKRMGVVQHIESDIELHA
jgi:hypothetical protein